MLTAVRISMLYIIVNHVGKLKKGIRHCYYIVTFWNIMQSKEWCLLVFYPSQLQCSLLRKPMDEGTFKSLRH